MNHSKYKTLSMKTRLLILSIIILFPIIGYSQIWEVNSDHWVATDALGRKLSDASEMGPNKEDKTVGMFYWSWHTDGNANWVMPDGTVANISEILEQYPDAVRDKDHAAWQNTPEGGGFLWHGSSPTAGRWRGRSRSDRFRWRWYWRYLRPLRRLQ